MKGETLNADRGFNDLVTFMDEILGKCDLADGLKKREGFEDHKRQDGQTVVKYVAKFDQNYQRTNKKRLKILAFLGTESSSRGIHPVVQGSTVSWCSPSLYVGTTAPLRSHTAFWGHCETSV